MIQFDLPKQHSSIIKVIGVGGGGSNAVNHMCNMGMEGVDFVICNTDAQSLAVSKVPNKIQLGPNLTQGLGAGMNPSIGRQATEESMEEIRRLLEVNTKMVFITAGMGGGTGTGGAPIVARMCREMGILTVGIVTVPFSYEGKKRIQQAEEGIAAMKQYVDTLLVISNDKLRHQFGNLTFKAAFSTADNVLATATRCITDVISSSGHINVDFADVCTVMRNGGVAILGSSRVEGENRAIRAIEQALNSPLLNDNNIHGAKWILINIVSAEGEHEFTVDEVEIIQQYLQANAGSEYDLFMGLGYDNSLDAQIGITIIATGFDRTDTLVHPAAGASLKSVIPTAEGPAKVIMPLDESASTPQATAKSEIEAPLPSPQDELTPRLFVLGSSAHGDQEVTDMQPNAASQPDALITGQGSLPLPTAMDGEVFQLHWKADDTSPQSHESVGVNHQASDEPVWNGFLSKPTRIYVEKEEPIQFNDPSPLPEMHPESMEESDPNSEMRLVIRANSAADGPTGSSVHQHSASNEDPALQDEAEELKRIRAAREHKLRNLSFKNYNAADPNNEYEQIPAFIRRSSPDKQQAQSTVPEQYYSNLTVNADENRDHAYLSTLNSFLEGKKPD